ncbi:MAG: linear amide C-N hydrolase [Pseudodesulfovibrio sp.]|uniref:linear amide C-N hydrolase n=1 Tax=Pseudodesulfovibrio sp. TaxID=2035812 RepID=UPI003D0FF24D
MKIRPLAILLVIATVMLATPSAQACTGITLKAEDGSVVRGRTGEFGTPLDIRLIVIPKGLPLDGGAVNGARAKTWTSKHAVAGVNALGGSYALDGLNDAGLSVGAFYFPDYAEYSEVSGADDGNVVSPLYFVNYALTQFATVDEVRKAVGDIKVAGAKEKEWGGMVPPFHWVVSDRSGASIVIEPVGGELVVHDNPLGVITNSPTFDWHMTNIRNFIYLNPLNVPPVELNKVEFKSLGQGSGLAGMPGDFTPPSRFVRAVVFSQSVFPQATGHDAVLQTFHILNQFDIPRGAAAGMVGGKREADITQATVAADLKSLKYYVTNYSSRRIKMIDLNRIDPDRREIIQIDLPKQETIDDLTPIKE